MLGVHHKTRLTPLDAMAYTPGRWFETFELFGVQVGVVICFEGFRFADTTRECVRQGAQVVFHPAEQHDAPKRLEGARAPRDDRHAGRREHGLVRLLQRRARSSIRTAARWSWRRTARSHAQTELRREELLVADLDVARATRAMFEFDRGGMADVLFADTVRPDEFAAAGPMTS